MLFNARCWTRPQIALGIATLFLIGCAPGGSDAPLGTCPPFVAYSPAEQLRVAEEVAALPEGAVIEEWLANYAVMREQARACADR